MMPTIEGAILGAIVAMFLGLGIVIFVQHHEVVTLQANYEHALKDSSALQAENDNWKNISATQNSKLVQLALAQKAADAAVAKAVAGAAKDARRYQILAAQITKLKTTPDDCASASMVKDFYLRNRK